MKVLIADRSFEIRARIKQLIYEFTSDPELYETESKFEAIEIAREEKPDVIITELDLFDGSGLNLLSELHSIRPYSILIVFTHLFQKDIENISHKLGADYFLEKPHGLIVIKQIMNEITDDSDSLV